MLSRTEYWDLGLVCQHVMAVPQLQGKQKAISASKVVKMFVFLGMI